jgi:hypothetical protein
MGKQMQASHADCNNKVEDCIDADGHKFRGNLSIRFPASQKPLLIIRQAKKIFYQFLFWSKSWHGPSGEHLILPNGEGDGIMLSAFTAQEAGFGF